MHSLSFIKITDMQEAIVSISISVLEGKDLKVAHDQYDEFVDIHIPVLSNSELKNNAIFHSMRIVLQFFLCKNCSFKRNAQ